MGFLSRSWIAWLRSRRWAGWSPGGPDGSGPEGWRTRAIEVLSWRRNRLRRSGVSSPVWVSTIRKISLRAFWPSAASEASGWGPKTKSPLTSKGASRSRTIPGRSRSSSWRRRIPTPGPPLASGWPIGVTWPIDSGWFLTSFRTSSAAVLITSGRPLMVSGSARAGRGARARPRVRARSGARRGGWTLIGGDPPGSAAWLG